MLAAAYAAHPERFPHGVPTPGRLPEAVWINKPTRCECGDGIARPGGPTTADLERPTDESIAPFEVIESSTDETEARGCPRNDNRDVPRDWSTPHLGVIEASEEEDLPATVH